MFPLAEVRREDVTEVIRRRYFSTQGFERNRAGGEPLACREFLCYSGSVQSETQFERIVYCLHGPLVEASEHGVDPPFDGYHANLVEPH